MPFQVQLSKVLSKAGWKVKVFDNERGPEEPHLTILCKGMIWRVSLRTGNFLVPPGGRWKDIPAEVIEAINADANLEAMRAYWDQTNPHNRVQSDDHESDG